MNGKTLLAAACLISLACGYIAGKAGRTSVAKTGYSHSQQPPTDRLDVRESRPRGTGDSALLESILGGRPIAEIPAAELAALIAKLSKYDPNIDPLTRAKQSYQLQLILAKLSAADLDGLATAIHSDQDPENNSSLGSILSSLAAKDPDRALAWLSACEMPGNMYSMVIGVIARDDPMAAADLLRNRLLDGSISQSSHFSAAYGIGQAIAKLGADPLLAYIDSLPSNQQSNMVSNVISSVPKGERIRLLDELSERMEDGRLTTTSLDHMFTAVLASGENGAKEWFSNLPNGEKKDSLRLTTATALFNRGEKEAATEWMREALAAAPGREKQTLQSIIMGMSYNNPEGIPFFAQLLPEGVEFTAEDLENEAANSLYSGTSGLTAIAAVISDPGEKARLIAESLEKISSGGNHRLNTNDFDILSHNIAAMGFTGENATLVSTALEAARNGRVLPPDKD